MKVATIIILSLLGINLLMAAHLHGKEKTGEFNFWITLASTALLMLLYWWAGLFQSLT
jgi:hypothetical protein